MSFHLTLFCYLLVFCTIVSYLPTIIEPKVSVNGKHWKVGKNGSLNSIVKGIPSSPKLFYVQVLAPEILLPPMFRSPSLPPRVYCGGSIIDKYWILTGAKCVRHFVSHRVHVKVGDFSDENSPKQLHDVSFWFTSDHLTSSDKYEHSLALVKLVRPIENAEAYIIPLCQERSRSELLGTAGMGLTSLRQKKLPELLQQTYLKESLRQVTTAYESVLCALSMVCTESASAIGYSRMCYLDEGSPLYTFECNTRNPKCLYGVGAYHWREDQQGLLKMCQASFFTSVPYNLDWIESILHNH